MKTQQQAFNKDFATRPESIINSKINGTAHIAHLPMFCPYKSFSLISLSASPGLRITNYNSTATTSHGSSFQEVPAGKDNRRTGFILREGTLLKDHIGQKIT